MTEGLSPGSFQENEPQDQVGTRLSLGTQNPILPSRMAALVAFQEVLAGSWLRSRAAQSGIGVLLQDALAYCISWPITLSTSSDEKMQENLSQCLGLRGLSQTALAFAECRNIYMHVSCVNTCVVSVIQSTLLTC